MTDFKSDAGRTSQRTESFLRKFFLVCGGEKYDSSEKFGQVLTCLLMDGFANRFGY